MAIAYRDYDPERDGILEVEELFPNCAEVYWVPPLYSLARAGLKFENASSYRVLLLLVNGQDNFISMYPIMTLAGKLGFMTPKYGRIKEITLFKDCYAPRTPEEVIEILERLPAAFAREIAYGLGFTKPLRFIVSAIENLTNCTSVVVSSDHPTGFDQDEPSIFYLRVSDLNRIRAELNKIDDHTRNAARSVKEVVAHNILAHRLDLPQLEVNEGRHHYRKRFTAAAQGKDELSKEDQNIVLNVMSNHVTHIADDQPEKLVKLRGDIELVSLKAFIKIYQGMINKKFNECHWQHFFSDNPFVLNMAFGYPLIKVLSQPSVGGGRLTGDGQKFADFLLKHSLTNNTAIVEIKTPQTEILNKKSYRKGVFAPTSHLTSSISQVLDQKYQFLKHFSVTKDSSRMHDIESYAVHCCLIIGRMPKDEDQKKSFELFRSNSKNVEVFTFDELLDKLTQLHTYLSDTETII